MTENYIVDPRVPYCHKRLLWDVARLCDRYSEILGVAAVGFSEQRREIPVVRLGKGKRKILAAGCIHGREYVSASFLMKSLEEYAREYESGSPCARALLSDFSFHIAPVCNPDSVEVALGREYPRVITEDFCPDTYKNNADNINLNANFPYRWEWVPSFRQGGSFPASAKETRFLIELCRMQEYEKMLSFHCRGDCLYWRDCGSGAVLGDEATADNLSSICGYSLCPPTEGVQDYSGGFENWFRHAFRRCGICVELVRDEVVSYKDMCRGFYYYTRWQDTKHTLSAAAMGSKI